MSIPRSSRRCEACWFPKLAYVLPEIKNINMEMGSSVLFPSDTFLFYFITFTPKLIMYHLHYIIRRIHPQYHILKILYYSFIICNHELS